MSQCSFNYHHPDHHNHLHHASASARQLHKSSTSTSSRALLIASSTTSLVAKSFTNMSRQLTVIQLAITTVLCLILSQPAHAALFLQPNQPEKAYWTGEQFMVTCMNQTRVHTESEHHLEWLDRDNQRIVEEPSNRIHVERTDDQGLRLVNLDTKKRDAGQYRCVMVQGGEARETIVFNLIVYEATNFHGTKENEIAQEGTSFTMTCHVRFDDDHVSAAVSWWFNNTPIASLENAEDYAASDHDPRRGRSTLTIKQVRKEHGGTYGCQAVTLNKHISDIRTHNINLRVQYKPKIDRTKTHVWILDPKISDRYERRRASSRRLLHHTDQFDLLS